MADEMNKLLEMAIQDTYSAETQALEALEQMEEHATSPNLKKAFQQHRQETERQIERLEKVATLLGIEPEGETCEAMEGLVEEAEEHIDEFEMGPVLDAALIGAAQKQEHYEIAAYGTITAMLKAMGQREAADLMAQTLKEEKDTDERLTKLAEQEVNPAALGTMAANDQSGSAGRGAA